MPGWQRWKWPATGTSISGWTAARMRRRCCAARPKRRRRTAKRSSSSTPTSIPTRRRTSAICATRRWAIRSCACCARGGKRVEVQNYIDNTGVQVADVVVGFHYLEKKTPADVRALLADPAVRFDYYCWDLYARTSSYYKDHPEALTWRSRDAARDRGGRGRSCGAGAPGGGCDRAGAPEDHAAAGCGVRRAAARERDSAPASSGRRRSSC